MKSKCLMAVLIILASLALCGMCSAQTQLVSDSFTGPMGTPLGSNWTGCGYNNGVYNKLDYENNAAGGGGYWGQDCALYTGYGPFPDDQYVAATVVAPVPSSTLQASIQLRGSAVPNSPEAYIACGWDAQDFPADFHYRIWSMGPNPASGGPTSLYLSNITPATNDVISCQVLGTTVSMTLNGNPVATVIDNSGIDSGYPGLYYVDPNSGGPTPTDIIFANFSAGSGPPIVSTSMNPPSASITTGFFVQYSGTITYADGTVATVSDWSSSSNSVAPIDSTGTAFGAGPGSATITGASGANTVTGNISVQAGDGYTPLVYDTFVGTGGPYLGSNWTGCGYYYGAYSKLVLQNNQAGGGGYGSQDCALYTAMSTFPADQFATATLVAQTPSTSPEASIELRANATPGTPESYIACGWDALDFASDQHYRIWSLSPDGSYISLYLSSVMPMPNDLLWCQVLGNTVTMQVNGNTIGVVTDTSGLTSGYPGLFYIDPNQDVPPVTDVVFDNFAAGSIDSAQIASLSVSPKSAQVNINSSVQLSATGTYTDGSVATVTNAVTWTSSNPSVATVGSTGLVTGVTSGTATITASSGMASSSAAISVNQKPPTVTFSGAPASAPYQGTFAVNATTNATVMPAISGTAGVCSVGAVTGSPAAASAVVTMLTGTGSCILSASWQADATYSAAGPLTQTTTASKIASTTTIVSHSPSPSTLGQAVSIGFSVAGGNPGATGSVTVTASTGESCSGTVSSGAGSCSITFQRSGSRTLTAAYGGNANYTASTSAGVSHTVNSPTVSLNPTSINFGTVSSGNTVTKTETVTNTGTGALINLSWSITGANANRYSVSSTTCGTTLNPGANCVFNLTFKSGQKGTQTASLVLTDNATNSPQTVALSGTGR